MKDKFVKYFKKVCKETGDLSTCASKKVGSVLTRNNRIIAIGYNGVPPGVKHCVEIFRADQMEKPEIRESHSAWSKLNESHSEENVIAFCAKKGLSTENTTLFVSLSPCINCAKLILSSGIKEVFYLEEYDRDKNGLKFLIQNGVRVKLV